MGFRVERAAREEILKRAAANRLRAMSHSAAYARGRQALGAASLFIA